MASSVVRIALLTAAALVMAAQFLVEPALARDPVLLAGGGITRELPLEALRALPAQTRDVAFLTSRGEETSHYTGAKLWDILIGNGLIDPAAHGPRLRSIVIVTARDGYTLVLSAGELAPDLGNTAVLLAYMRDDAPIEAARSPRLIVPGDARGARNVLDVARIEVRQLAPSPEEKTP